MRPRLLTSIVAASLLLTLPAAASAAPTRLKVRECQAGDTAKERRATFYARMHAIPGTVRMQMRFTLIERSSTGSSPVRSPALARWRRSRTGVKRFGYAQTVSGLRAGSSYAMAVDYRWIGASGRAIRSARRTSADCRQDGDLANLSVAGITSEPGSAAGTEQYEVEVINRGTRTAEEFRVDLFVDSALADTALIHELEPGETTTVTISGPSCLARVRAVADRGDAVRETTEDDNVLRAPCPARQ